MWDKDYIYFVIILVAAFISVYIIPVLSYPLFIIFFGLAYISKKDYIWLAFIIVLMDAPGNLFSAGMRDDIMRLPLYSFGPGFSFSTIQVFMFVFLVKHFPYNNFKNNIFHKDLRILFIFIILVFLYSAILGMSTGTVINTVRSLLNWAWVIIFIQVINTPHDVKKIFQLLFPVVLIALGTQIYAFMTGHHLDDMLRGIDPRATVFIVEEGVDRTARSGSSPYILLLSFIISLYFIFNNHTRYFHSAYLYIVTASCYLSVFLSGTRGWIIATTAIIGLVLLTQLNSQNLLRMIGLLIAGIVIISFAYVVYPNIQIQIDNVFNRIETVDDLAKGDITAGGTLQRWDVRGPYVFNKYKERPLTGWGFSDKFYEYNDPHVGHHSLLLNVGLIGYIIVIAFFIKWNIIINRSTKILNTLDPGVGRPYIIFSIGLIAILIIHSSSTQLIGIYLGLYSTKYVVYALLLSAFSVFYNHELEEYEDNTSELNNYEMN